MNKLNKFMLNSNIIEFTNDHLDINTDFYNIAKDKTSLGSKPISESINIK